MKIIQGFRAAKHAPKGQKTDAFIETALGYTPLEKYEQPLETKFGPQPQEMNTVQAYQDLMRLADIMGSLKAKTVIAESESDNFNYKITSRLKGIADIVEKAKVISVNARHNGLSSSSTTSEAQDKVYEEAIKQYLTQVQDKNAYRLDTASMFRYSSDAGELEKRLVEVHHKDGISLQVWNGQQEILGALKAGYNVVTKIAKAGVPIEGDLAQAAKIVLKYQGVIVLDGFLNGSQIASETARVNADPRIKAKNPSEYSWSSVANFGIK